MPCVIATTKGNILVDDEDFEYLTQYTWYIDAKGYACTKTSRKLGKQKELKMHRLITNCPKGLVVDHANRNKLDNRKENLRVTNQSMNGANRTMNEGKRFKGIQKHHNKWRAWITQNGNRIHLGLFDTPEKAAEAYNIKAKELFGEFARLNELKGVM